MRIIINTISTKKHSGGAFQIAQNFLLRSLEHTEIEWYYIISQDIDEAIGDKFAHLKGSTYFVFPTQPDFMNSYLRVKKELFMLEERINPDVVYSVTAPSYFSFKHTEVMRFTNPWVTHPNQFSWSVLSNWMKFKTTIYCLNQKRLMRKVNYFITQTETTKQGILNITGLPAKNVKVVSNVLPAVFNGMDKSQIKEDNWIDVACVGNPVPHKNFDIVPNVIYELTRAGISNVRFHLTIPKGHRMERIINDKANHLGVSDNLVMHGRMTQAELGAMYRKCQLCFLPSLLEVFSASTVEAMYFGLPIVAADFSFNREVLAESCLYYTPKDEKDAARQFERLINNTMLQKECRSRMETQLMKYGDYDTHFNAIKDFLVEVANHEMRK